MNDILITLRSRCARILALLIIGSVIAVTGHAVAAETAPALFSSPPAGSAAKARLDEKRATEKTPVARQRAVGINFKHLEPLEGRRSLALAVELFDGVTLLADLDRVEIRGRQNYSWFGKVRGLPNSRATLTVVNGILAGNLLLLDDWNRLKGSYQIQFVEGGLYALEELDPSTFPADHPPGIDPHPPLPPMRFDVPLPIRTEKAAGPVTIDVMVVYSNETAAAAGSAIGAQIQAAVDSANTIYANSSINARLRLVYSGPANYNQSGNFDTDLDRLTSTGDGVMDDIHALRDTYGADLVSLWIETSQYCGIGWVGPYASYAFTVVNRGCATGNSTFAHELGHNMGALHDPYMDPSTNPFSYGHGHVNLVARWRTVMAYNNQCTATAPYTSCTRIPYFSNPNLAYGGAPLGTADAGATPTSDNSRVINNVAATVAAFRPTVVDAPCTYALSPTTASPAATGGSATVTVTTQTGCAWAASSSALWLTISAPASGNGNGIVTYATSANTGAARTGTLSIGGSTVTVTQAALACSYTLSPASGSFSATAGSGTVTVTAPTGCTWTAASSASWLTVTFGASGSGNGTVGYSASANTGVARTANLTVGGKTFTVTQATGCTYSVSPTSVSASATASSGTVAVTAGSGCTWTATSNASWLTVDSGASGSGNGSVSYVASANTGAARTAALTIGGKTVTVAQAALSCSYTLSPASGSFTAAAGSGTVTMTAPTGCAWTAASSASWLSVSAGASGSGNGTVTYAATANTGVARSATLTVGGKTFAVTQQAVVIVLPPTGTNVALASAGAVASASSSHSAGFPASAVNNGDRAGLNPGNGGYWNDGTLSAFPDWVQIDFNGTKSIDRVVVYTLQDNYTAPVEPTDTLTFTRYGITDFTVQGWNGSGWVDLSTVTGNNLVKRTVSFSAFATNRIRINVTAATNGVWSRITEIEAWGSPIGAQSSNVALADAGAVASASSSHSAGFPASAVNNGDRAGLNPGNGGYWNDGTLSAFPDWVQIDFNGTKSIDRVVVYTLQDNYTAPVEPTDTLTFTRYGITDFTVQGWNGSGWVDLSTVTGNNLVKRTVSFSAFATNRIRINVTAATNGVWSRITEIEAWGSPIGAQSSNVALADAGAVASASSSHSAGFPASAVNNGDRAGLNPGNGGYWNDGTLSAFPDWVQIDFNGTKSIDRVVVYTLQDNYTAPVEPTDTLTFTRYGITDFTVQGWNGSGWVDLSTVTGNNLVKRTVSFSAFATNRIRINVTAATNGVWSRITEIEAWGG